MSSARAARNTSDPLALLGEPVTAATIRALNAELGIMADESTVRAAP